VTALVVAIGVGGLALWARTSAEPVSMFCTLGGAIDTPVRNSPDAAFDAWWDEGGAAEQSAGAVNYDRTLADVDSPAKSDFDRESDTVWRWYRGRGRAVKVDVYQSPEGWYVGGVNGCVSGQP
jgi:hypothetical protein